MGTWFDNMTSAYNAKLVLGGAKIVHCGLQKCVGDCAIFKNDNPESEACSSTD